MNNSKSHPKILIIGNYLNLYWGGGITLFNLLKGWPKEKIAVAANKIDEDGLEICTSYYRFGYDEYKRPWPLNKFQPYYKSGEVDFNQEGANEKKDMSEYQFKPSKYNKSRKLLVYKWLHNLGIYYFFFPFKVTPGFVNWVKKVNPDIIYTQLSMPEQIWFHRKLLKQVDIPLTIHIMDDWPKIINKPGLSHLYWNRQIQGGFRYLLKKAAGLMSICQYMGDEYKKRYGHEFVPFHNCIDLNKWSEYSKNNWSFSGNFQVLYAGRIGPGTSRSVLLTAKAVEKLAESGLNIEFQLQCKTIPGELKSEFEALNHTVLNPFLAYDDLPKKFASVDLLVLPMDFDKENLDFIHLSMPTKVPEYMSTGTPIFVFAHSSTALYNYAKSDNWAFTLCENSLEMLVDKIKTIYENENYRKEIGEKAMKIAKINHEGEKVREDFRKFLSSV